MYLFDKNNKKDSYFDNNNLFILIFQTAIDSCDGKTDFSASYSSLQCHMILTNVEYSGGLLKVFVETKIHFPPGFLGE